MDQSRPEIRRREEPVDERGDLKEKPVTPRDHPPPPRADSMTFPTNRLPQLDVPIIKRFPDVASSPKPQPPPPDINDNHNLDPELPLPVVPEKTMFNIWEKTRTQTEVKWTKPENAGNFSSIAYEIQLKNGDTDWQDLTENRVPVYRVYFAEGKAIFGRTKISQENTTMVIRLRVRPVGLVTSHGKEERKLGPWSEDILFSLEGTDSKH